MENITEGEARAKLDEIARKYSLKSYILRDVIRGKEEGLTQKEISKKYGYHENTISRYNKVLKEEFSDDELIKLLLIIGIIVGGAYLLKEIFGGE